MKAELILGCWGREKDGFINCPGVSNIILDITKNTNRNILIAELLDKTYNLFEKPLYSNIHTAIWRLQDQFSEVGNPLFENKFFKNIEEFCVEHKKCGIYLRLNFHKEEKIGEKMRDIVFVLDIDGTVCDSIERVKKMCEDAEVEYSCKNADQLWSNNLTRKFFDEKEIAKDKAIEESLKVFTLIKKLNAKYLFLTARNEHFKKHTLNWLVDNLGVPESVSLIMRTEELESVSSPDFKEKVFLEQVYNNNPDAFYLFFDDDSRVIERFSKYGLAFLAPDCWKNISIKEIA